MGIRRVVAYGLAVLMVTLLGTQVAWGRDWFSDKYLYLYGAAGWDYDSNASQKPFDPVAAATVRGKDAATYMQNAKIGYRINPDGPWDLETTYEYYQNFHASHPEGLYDTLIHTIGLNPSYLMGSTKFYLPFYFNYTDVASSKYATSYRLTPTVFHRFSEKWGVEGGMNLARDYAVTPLTLSQYDRSGRMIGGLLGVYYFIPNDKGYVQTRFSYDYFWGAGSSNNNTGSRIHLFANAVFKPRPKIALQGFIDLELQPYVNGYFDGVTTSSARNDTILNLGAVVTYNITKRVGINGHYYFTRDWSNVSLYSFDRHMVGGLLTFTYGQL